MSQQIRNLELDKLRERLVEEIAKRNNIPADIVRKTVMWHFKDLRTAMTKCSTIEVAGLGTFILSEFKAKKKERKLSNAVKRHRALLDSELPMSEKKRGGIERKLNDLVEKLALTKDKLNRFNSNDKS